MPNYTYECNECRETFEAFRDMAHRATAACPNCGEKARKIVDCPNTGIYMSSKTLYDMTETPVTVQSARDADRKAAAAGVTIDRLREPKGKKLTFY